MSGTALPDANCRSARPRAAAADRARTRRALATAHRRHADMVDRLPVGVVVVVGDEVRFANPMAARMRGVGVGDLLGQSLLQWLRPEDRPRAQMLLAAREPDRGADPSPVLPVPEVDVRCRRRCKTDPLRRSKSDPPGRS
jgi:PAS domain-containing protein